MIIEYHQHPLFSEETKCKVTEAMNAVVKLYASMPTILNVVELAQLNQIEAILISKCNTYYWTQEKIYQERTQQGKVTTHLQSHHFQLSELDRAFLSSLRDHLPPSVGQAIDRVVSGDGMHINLWVQLIIRIRVSLTRRFLKEPEDPWAYYPRKA